MEVSLCLSIGEVAALSEFAIIIEDRFDALLGWALNSKLPGLPTVDMDDVVTFSEKLFVSME